MHSRNTGGGRKGHERVQSLKPAAIKCRLVRSLPKGNPVFSLQWSPAGPLASPVTWMSLTSLHRPHRPMLQALFPYLASCRFPYSSAMDSPRAFCCLLRAQCCLPPPPRLQVLSIAHQSSNRGPSAQPTVHFLFASSKATRRRQLHQHSKTRPSGREQLVGNGCPRFFPF